MKPPPDSIDVEVGARIRAARKSLSLSQTKLAVAVGVTFQQIQKYERGYNRVSASMLVHIARELGATVGALVGEEGQHASPRTEAFRGLGVAGALELLTAFAEIPDAEVRRAIVQLTKKLAEGALQAADA
jgi:transcriptional regulator with XRE-family HTH domain